MVVAGDWAGSVVESSERTDGGRLQAWVPVSAPAVELATVISYLDLELTAQVAGCRRRIARLAQAEADFPELFGPKRPLAGFRPSLFEDLRTALTDGAAREARDHQRDQIEPEDLFVAILADPNRLTFHVCQNAGITLDTARVRDLPPPSMVGVLPASTSTPAAMKGWSRRRTRTVLARCWTGRPRSRGP